MKVLAAACVLALCVCAAQAKTAAPKEEGAVVGVGVEIKIQDGYPVIVSLIPHGPAARNGELEPGDRIEGVAQGDGAWEPTHGLKLPEVVALIRGPRGSKVSLRVTRPGADGTRHQVVVELKRAPLAPQKK